MIKTPRFNLILARFTTNTYVLVVIPPGEAELECTRFNLLAARDEFLQLDDAGSASERDRGKRREELQKPMEEEKFLEFDNDKQKNLYD